MKNKWLIALLVLIVIAFIYMTYGNSSSVPTNRARNTTNSSILKSINTGSASNKAVSQTQTTSTADTSGAYVIYYTNSGFSPAQLQVPQGKSVKFINDSNKALLVRTDDKSKSASSELNQSVLIGHGGVYMINLSQVGVWPFYNLDNPADKGNIVVY